jgi:hypothetical protein
LDVLLGNSNEFSLEAAKKYLDLLTRLFFVCSSTIVYVALSSFFVSACIIYVKNQISNHKTDIQKHLPADLSENTTNLLSPSLISDTFANTADSFEFLLNDIELEQNKSATVIDLNEYECNFSAPNKLNLIHLRFENEFQPRMRAYDKFKKNYILSRFLL